MKTARDRARNLPLNEIADSDPVNKRKFVFYLKGDHYLAPLFKKGIFWINYMHYNYNDNSELTSLTYFILAEDEPQLAGIDSLHWRLLVLCCFLIFCNQHCAFLDSEAQILFGDVVSYVILSMP